ncbi:RHS repeat-associated core domain-containing protein [Actinomadura verrucosospora]|uniref:RHS repeat-associated core domain-containing protein n=1 Tax=Actinomadura verrucosospora TaxID=46165 RepID=UPI0035EC84FC
MRAGPITAVRYYRHAGQNVAYRTGVSSSTVQFLVPEYQGSADTTVNAVYQDNWSVRRFAPFGNERSSPIGVWPTLMDRGYVGGTKDTTTGLTHLGAREYDPVTGRFLSADPVTGGGDPLTANGYFYAGNNPSTTPTPPANTATTASGQGPAATPTTEHASWDDANQHHNSFRRGGAAAAGSAAKAAGAETRYRSRNRAAGAARSARSAAF